MGSGKPLPAEVRDNLIPGLRRHPTTIILLAYHDGQPIGIAVCFHGFSTFNARPLINIHDLAILPAHRGRGVGRRLLAAVEHKARQLDCCKITLEVQTNNHKARAVYAAAGFAQTVHEPAAGGALFLSKPLPSVGAPHPSENTDESNSAAGTANSTAGNDRRMLCTYARSGDGHAATPRGSGPGCAYRWLFRSFPLGQLRVRRRGRHDLVGRSAARCGHGRVFGRRRTGNRQASHDPGLDARHGGRRATG